MSYLIGIDNKHQINWSKEEVVERLKGLMKGKRDYWVRADLSLCKSNRLTQFIWHYVVRHFSWMRKLFYKIDLKQSTAILSQIRTQVIKSPDLDLIHLFNVAVKNYNHLSNKASNHLKEIDGPLLKINISGKLPTSIISLQRPASGDGITNNQVGLEDDVKKIIFTYLDPNALSAIAMSSRHNRVAVFLHHTYRVGNLLGKLREMTGYGGILKYDNPPREDASWHLAILLRRMGMKYIPPLPPLPENRDHPLSHKLALVNFEYEARIDPWSNITLLTRQVGERNWAKAHQTINRLFFLFLTKEHPNKLDCFITFLSRIDRLLCHSKPREYIRLEMGKNLNDLLDYAQSQDAKTAWDLLKSIGYTQEILGNHPFAQNAFNRIFTLEPDDPFLKHITSRQVNSNNFEGAKHSLNAHYALCRKKPADTYARMATLNEIAQKYYTVGEHDQAKTILSAIQEDLLEGFKGSPRLIRLLIEHIDLYIKLYDQETALLTFKEVLEMLAPRLQTSSMELHEHMGLLAQVIHFQSILSAPSKELKEALIQFDQIYLDRENFSLDPTAWFDKGTPESYKLILDTYQVVVEENQAADLVLKIERLLAIAQRFRKLEDYDRAQKVLTSLQQLIETRPENYPVENIFIVSVHNQIDKGQVEAAKMSLNLMEEPPLSAEAEHRADYQFNRALLHLRLGDVGEANARLTNSFDIIRSYDSYGDARLACCNKRKKLIEMGYRDQTAIALSAEIQLLFTNTIHLDRRPPHFQKSLNLLVQKLYDIKFIDQAHAALRECIKLSNAALSDPVQVSQNIQDIFIQQVKLADLEGAKESSILMEAELGKNNLEMNAYHLFGKKWRFEGILCLEKAYNLIGLHPRDHTQEYEPALETFQQRLAREPDKLKEEINQLPLISLKIMAWSGVVREQLKCSLNLARESLQSMKTMADGIEHPGFRHEAKTVIAELYMAMGDSAQAEQVVMAFRPAQRIPAITRIIEEAARSKIISPHQGLTTA